MSTLWRVVKDSRRSHPSEAFGSCLGGPFSVDARCIVLINPHLWTLHRYPRIGGYFHDEWLFLFNRFREHSGTSPKQQLLFLFSFHCYAITRKASDKSFSSCVVDAMCELIRPVESMISYKYTNVLNLLLPEVRLRMHWNYYQMIECPCNCLVFCNNGFLLPAAASFWISSSISTHVRARSQCSPLT